MHGFPTGICWNSEFFNVRMTDIQILYFKKTRNQMDGFDHQKKNRDGHELKNRRLWPSLLHTLVKHTNLTILPWRFSLLQCARRIANRISCLVSVGLWTLTAMIFRGMYLFWFKKGLNLYQLRQYQMVWLHVLLTHNIYYGVCGLLVSYIWLYAAS